MATIKLNPCPTCGDQHATLCLTEVTHKDTEGIMVDVGVRCQEGHEFYFGAVHPVENVVLNGLHVDLVRQVVEEFNQLEPRQVVVM